MNDDELTILGAKRQDSITADELETFPAPPGCYEVEFSTQEFTAICPVTHQPDSYEVTIRYLPQERCIESKSLKLWLWSFRDQGIFAEGIAAELAHRISVAAGGVASAVRVVQSVRGGIVTTTYGRAGDETEDWQW